MTKSIGDLIASRRALLGGLAALPLLKFSASPAAPRAELSFANVAATNADTITLPPGYSWTKLIAWGDALFDTIAATFDPDRLTRTEQEQRFGQNNDMLAMFPAHYQFPWSSTADEFVICVNNEQFDPALSFPALASRTAFSAAHWEALYASVGVSVVQISRNGGVWRPHKDAAPGRGANRRITPFTPVVFTGPAAQHRWIAAASARVNAAEPGRTYEPTETGAVRCGTLANCSGGRTPWGTFLTSEENFDGFFVASDANAAPLADAQSDQAWIYDAGKFGYPLFSASGGDRQPPRQFDVSLNPYGPSLYGWVVEIDPYDPHWAPRKRTALGRKKGEAATTALGKDGRVVTYMGDDQIGEFIYKFVSRARFDPNDRRANRDLLDDGQLYVARLQEDGTGVWLPLTLASANVAIADAPYHAPFLDDGDLMMRTREAARLLGATPMDRPEDIESPVDANWAGHGVVLAVCTYNRNEDFYRPGNPRRGDAQNAHVQQSNVCGHILRFDEDDADNCATTFRWDVFALAGDPEADGAFTLPNGVSADVSVTLSGAAAISGARFACPDNICFDSAQNVWIATDGSNAVFADCNDAVLAAPLAAPAPRPMKRFLVGPVGAEICGPAMAPDDRAFFACIQHPGESDLTGTDIAQLRWTNRQAPPSHFPDGAGAWPRSAVIVVTREDGGRIGG